MGGRKERRRYEMEIPRTQRPRVCPAVRTPSGKREILLRRQRDALVSRRRRSGRFLRSHVGPRLHDQRSLQHELLQGLAQSDDGKRTLENNGSQKVQFQVHACVFHGHGREEQEPYERGKGGVEKEERRVAEGVRVLHHRRA